MSSIKVGPTIADDIKKNSFFAVFGSLIGADQTNYPTTSNCYEEKFYITETYNLIMDSKINICCCRRSVEL